MNPQVLLGLLGKEKKAWDRAFLVEIVGEIRLEEAVPVLLNILNEETDKKTIKATITALGLIGDSSACGPVSEYLYTENLDLVITAIRTLGQLGTPTAIQRLEEKIGTDPDLDLIIFDVFARIQSPESLDKLNQTLKSHYAHIRTTGKQKLVEIGAKAVPVLTQNLLYNDPDLLIHSLNVLGNIGDKAAIPAIRRLIHNNPKDPNVRFAAYESLGMLPVQKGAYVLAAGLEDPVENVRAAAARAIDINYDTALAAGMKNMTGSGNEEARKIIYTIIDSQCDNIFLSLVKEDYFQKFAFEYLTDKAHPDLRTHFIKLLREKGEDDLAKEVSGKKKPVSENKIKVFAVDDSKMILNIFKSMLHKLGYDSYQFELPAEAMEEIRKEKPDIVLTDLNMPEISGIELTKSIRELYDKEELPIIMVTTQNDTQDNEAANEAGVNGILRKPFTDEQISETLAKFVEMKTDH